MPAVSILVGATPIALVSGEKWSEVYEYAYHFVFNGRFLPRLKKWTYQGKPMWDGFTPITLCRGTEEQEKQIGVKNGHFCYKWLRVADIHSMMTE